MNLTNNMDKLLLFAFMIGCLAAVLGTPPPVMYSMDDDGYSGGGGAMTGMMDGGSYPMTMGGIGMGGDMGSMYGSPVGGYGGYGGYMSYGRYGRFGRPRYCKCRKHCRRWERYMGKCWHCRWWRCRVRCCRY